MENPKLKKLNMVDVGDEELVTGKDFAEVMNALIQNINEFRERITKRADGTGQYADSINEDLKALAESVKKRFESVTKMSSSKLEAFKLKVQKSLDNLQDSIDELELKHGEDGEDGKDAEITEEVKDELIEAVLKKFKKENDPKFKEQIEEAVEEAVKKIKPNTIFVSGGDSGAPFEIPIKGGTNVTVHKDASGAYVISASGGSSTDLARNEVVAGSNNDWTLAHTPIGEVAIYGGGSRLLPTDDFTISGVDITTTNAYSAGQLLADYEY